MTSHHRARAQAMRATAASLVAQAEQLSCWASSDAHETWAADLRREADALRIRARSLRALAGEDEAFAEILDDSREAVRREADRARVHAEALRDYRWTTYGDTLAAG